MHDRSLALFLLLGSTLLAPACGSGDRAGPPGRSRNLILLTCDTLRADRLGLYGWPGSTSPHLDGLASECRVYESAWSTAPLTGPSLSALLTGRTPKEVGLGNNKSLLSAEAVTLAERLTEQGFACAAVVSNGVLRRRAELPGAGVQQGFAHFDDEMGAVELNRPFLKERAAPETTDAALGWLAQRDRERPFFLWVHYQDPHGPYTAPDEYLRPGTGAGSEPPLEPGPDQRGFRALPLYQVLGEERDPEVYRRRYEAEIRFFDHELGRLLAALRAEGLLEDSLLVFTADHGESLGEHGFYFSHGQNLHRELVRVPLLLREPGPGVAGTRVAQPASHLDLWPTILGALGLPAGDVLGVDLLAGAPDPERALPQFLSRQWSLTSGRRRLIFADGKPGLFDVQGDPLEQHDLAASEPEVTQRLLDQHAALMRRIEGRRLKAAVPDASPQLDQELDALGYGGDGDDD